MQSTDLKIGVISANFNLSGNIPSLMQELNISVSIGAQVSILSFSNLMPMPVVDFAGSNFLISDETTSVVNKVKSKISSDLFCSIAIILG